MNRAVVLEGHDESGKTTLGSDLVRLTSRHIVTIGPHPRTRSAALVFCKLFLAHMRNGAIMDRCTPISELVYRSFFGNIVMSPEEMWDILDYANNSFHPCYVHCKPSIVTPPTVKGNYDPEIIETLTTSADAIRYLYDVVFEDMRLRGYNVVVYDFCTMTSEQLLKEIENV